MPWINERMLQHAIERLPAGQRERYAEEWKSYINDIPRKVSKLVAALGLFSAARRMSLIARRRSTLPESSSRIVDIAVSSILLAFFAPLLVAAAILIKLNGNDRVLQRRQRVGLNGRTFWMYSLGLPLLDVLKAPSAQRNRRLTYLGCFLWKAGIHELPVLVNVIRGEMSLLGPVPHSPEEARRLSKLIPGYAARQQVKPGANFRFLPLIVSRDKRPS